MADYVGTFGSSIFGDGQDVIGTGYGNTSQPVNESTGSFLDQVASRGLTALDYWIEGAFGQQQPTSQPVYLTDPRAYSVQAAQPVATPSQANYQPTSGTGFSQNPGLWVAGGLALLAAFLLVKA